MVHSIVTNIFPHPFPDIVGEKSSFNETGIFVPDLLLSDINILTNDTSLIFCYVPFILVIHLFYKY